MEDNNWYKPKENWYRPLAEKTVFGEQDTEDIFDALAELPETGAAEETPVKKEKKKRKSGWAWLVSLLALLLVIGSVAVFGNMAVQKMKGLIRVSFGSGDNVSTYTFSKDSGDTEDGSAEFPAGILPGDGSSDELPEDWNDYFDAFYTGVDTTYANIDIKSAKLPIDFEMELEDPGTKELSLQKLYSGCADSVVAILGYIDGEEYSWGTGIILSSDGLILTNTHVIDGCDAATVTLTDDRIFEALLVGADSTSDIAVLKIDADKLTSAHFSRSDALIVGDPVVAIGNPLGETFKLTLTDGIISGIDRGVEYNGRTMTVLQTNTALNSGNSGGPLFNMYGQVIGVTNMKMMSSYSSIEGIGFAIPTTTVRQIVNGLVKDGEYRGRPSIGMTVGAVPESAKEYYSLPGGLYITDVTEGSGADDVGLKKGDIVTEVNHKSVSATNDVLTILEDFSVGDKLPMTVWRDGELFELEVELKDMNDIYGK